MLIGTLTCLLSLPAQSQTKDWYFGEIRVQDVSGPYVSAIFVSARESTSGSLRTFRRYEISFITGDSTSVNVDERSLFGNRARRYSLKGADGNPVLVANVAQGLNELYARGWKVVTVLEEDLLSNRQTPHLVVLLQKREP